MTIPNGFFSAVSTEVFPTTKFENQVLLISVIKLQYLFGIDTSNKQNVFRAEDNSFVK